MCCAILSGSSQACKRRLLANQQERFPVAKSMSHASPIKSVI